MTDRAGGTTGLRGTASGREFVALVACCMAMAALAIDVMLPAFPHMREEFGLEPGSTEVSRVITAFFIGLAVGQLFYGPLSDRFGRKRLLYSGIALYTAAALAATQMSTLDGFVICRFVWGLGAAAPRSLALAMVRDTHEGERMARTVSHVMAVFILVPVFAPGAGSLLLELAEWRIVLWLPITLAAVMALWAMRLPETLPPERRRSVSPAALGEAFVAVVRNRQTLAFGLAATFLFGIMTSYIGSSEIIVDEVFGQGDHFSLIFGVVACMFGVGSLLSARFVMQLGLDRLVRLVAVYVVTAASVLMVVVLTTDGRPPMWLFGIVLMAMLPGVTALVPNCNTAAMAPLGHVAGMASAVLGTISTAGGAVLGNQIDGAFDGTVRPFATGALLYGAVAAGLILFVARPSRRLSGADAALAANMAVSVGDVAGPGEPVLEDHA